MRPRGIPNASGRGSPVQPAGAALLWGLRDPPPHLEFGGGGLGGGTGAVPLPPIRRDATARGGHTRPRAPHVPGPAPTAAVCVGGTRGRDPTRGRAVQRVGAPCSYGDPHAALPSRPPPARCPPRPSARGSHPGISAVGFPSRDSHLSVPAPHPPTAVSGPRVPTARGTHPRVPPSPLPPLRATRAALGSALPGRSPRPPPPPPPARSDPLRASRRRCHQLRGLRGVPPPRQPRPAVQRRLRRRPSVRPPLLPPVAHRLPAGLPALRGRPAAPPR